MEEKFTEEEIQRLDLYNRHWDCGGGEIEQIGTVAIGYGDIPEWRCKNCGATYYASDYENHAGYWASKYSKQQVMESLPLIFGDGPNKSLHGTQPARDVLG